MNQSSSLSLEWNQDEPSESGDFILVESKAKEKREKEKSSVSPSSQGGKQDQQNSGLYKQKGAGVQPKPLPQGRKNK